jgi:hypothetical protein
VIRAASTVVKQASPSHCLPFSCWLLIVFFYLHLTLYKYFPKPLNLLTLLHPIIFLYVTPLILSHLTPRNLYFHLLVSGHFWIVGLWNSVFNPNVK